MTVANCIKARYDAGISNQRQDGTMVLEVTYEKDTTKNQYFKNSLANFESHGTWGATGVIEWISEVADENCKDKTSNI